MHYYKFNIGDYRRDAAHLSLLEHGIYRQLIDTYYLDEKPIEKQLVIRRLSIKTEDEINALNNVLNDFFEPSDCEKFWSHERIDQEISQYHEKSEKLKANGSKGGRPKKAKKTKLVNSANKMESKSKGNQEPITINQEPITNTKNTCPEPDVSEPEPKEIFEIPTKKFNTTGEIYRVTDQQVWSWSKTYRLVDVRQELRELISWNKASPSKRKTMAGMQKHITGWLSREQANAESNQRRAPRKSKADVVAEQSRKILAECEAEEAGYGHVVEDAPAVQGALDSSGGGSDGRVRPAH